MVTPAIGSKYRPPETIGLIGALFGRVPEFALFLIDYYNLRNRRGTVAIGKRDVKSAAYNAGFPAEVFRIYWDLMLACGFLKGAEEDGYWLASKAELVRVKEVLDSLKTSEQYSCPSFPTTSYTSYTSYTSVTSDNPEDTLTGECESAVKPYSTDEVGNWVDPINDLTADLKRRGGARNAK